MQLLHVHNPLDFVGGFVAGYTPGTHSGGGNNNAPACRNRKNVHWCTAWNDAS